MTKNTKSSAPASTAVEAAKAAAARLRARLATSGVAIPQALALEAIAAAAGARDWNTLAAGGNAALPAASSIETIRMTIEEAYQRQGEIEALVKRIKAGTLAVEIIDWPTRGRGLSLMRDVWCDDMIDQIARSDDDAVLHYVRHGFDGFDQQPHLEILGYMFDRLHEPEELADESPEDGADATREATAAGTRSGAPTSIHAEQICDGRYLVILFEDPTMAGNTSLGVTVHPVNADGTVSRCDGGATILEIGADASDDLRQRLLERALDEVNRMLVGAKAGEEGPRIRFACNRIARLREADLATGLSGTPAPETATDGDRFARLAEEAARAERVVPGREMGYEAWLDWTGKDDSFVGSPEAGIPGTHDLYEAAMRLVRAGQGRPPRR